MDGRLRTPIGAACVRCNARLSRQKTMRTGWTSGRKDWDDCVKELAMRGFTLRALLHLYKMLGTVKVMPHYDPTRHTTADVVRQAIVPLSRSQRYGNCALATVLMKGRPTLPRKMVTHTWSNLFSHLVAAIVADALGEPEYGHVVQRMQKDITALESELSWKGKLNETYWVCAVSVNQHAGICDMVFPTDIDPATGLQHPACPCAAKKHLSNTPPTRPDGQGIRCEMNKFDDMMEYLAELVPNFAQVIAVDASFNLFQRAWCVAELHRAHTLQMPQHMRLHCEHSCSLHQQNLKDLKVEDMRASNPDDKEMILGKIADKAAFNAEIQHLIFGEGGLLQGWRTGFDMVAMLGKVARRGYERMSSSSSSMGSQTRSASPSGAAEAPSAPAAAGACPV